MVSVIIPNYNHSLYLRQRIDSVLGQTYQDIEVIIMDDCSKDNSRDIIEQYRSHPKVSRIVYNEQNSGSTFKQWNKGVELAKGEYIWIAESDDLADKELLQTLVAKTKVRHLPGLVYCQSHKLNSKDIVTGSWLEWTDNLDNKLFLADFELNGLAYIEQFLIHKNTIPNASAVLFNKKVYQAAGGADETVKNCSDWLLWIKMLLISDVAFVAKPLNYFRYHEHSVIATAVKGSRPDQYYEKYDRTMRLRLKEYLQRNPLEFSTFKRIEHRNYKYIIEENGLEGAFEIRKKRFLSGWIKIIKASLAVRTLSYLRLVLQQE